MVTPRAIKIERTDGETWVDYHIRVTRKVLHPNSFNFALPEKPGDALMMEYGFGRRIPFGWYAYQVAKLMTLYVIKGYQRVAGKSQAKS